MGGRSRGASSPRTCGSSTTSNEDFSESTDLAASNPAKLKELQALFMKEAEKYRVLPIDDRSSSASIRPWRAGPT